MSPEEIIGVAVDGVRELRLAQWEKLRGLCESPIEELFLAAAFGRGIDSALAAHIYASPFSDGGELFYGDHLWPQAKVGNYRVDFLIANVDRQGHKTFVAVECDGHEFHERTKEQAARDKMRDRYLVGRGIRVLRFTGAEIFHDPICCWAETLNVLWRTNEAA